MQAACFHRFNLVGTSLKYRFILMTSQRVVPNTNVSSHKFDAAYTSLIVDGEDRAPPRLVRDDPPCLSVSHPSLILVCIGVQVDDDELSSVLDGADLSCSLLQPRKQVNRRHLISSQVHMMILPIPHPGP